MKGTFLLEVQLGIWPSPRWINKGGGQLEGLMLALISFFLPLRKAKRFQSGHMFHFFEGLDDSVGERALSEHRHV